MSRKSLKKPLAFAIGAAFAGSMAATSMVNAAENPFEMTKLNSGYQQVAKEGKCGEGKCGSKTDADKKDKTKCGDKADAKKKEGKCGEGKCGSKK